MDGRAIRIRQCVRQDRDRARFELAITISRESGVSLLKLIKKREEKKKERACLTGFYRYTK